MCNYKLNITKIIDALHHDIFPMNIVADDEQFGQSMVDRQYWDNCYLKRKM